MKRRGRKPGRQGPGNGERADPELLGDRIAHQLARNLLGPILAGDIRLLNDIELLDRDIKAGKRPGEIKGERHES